MPNIDTDSLTWKAVLSFVDEQHKEAVDSLIADRRSEQQRGVIACLDKLKNLATQSTDTPVTEVNYN